MATQVKRRVGTRVAALRSGTCPHERPFRAAASELATAPTPQHAGALSGLAADLARLSHLGPSRQSAAVATFRGVLSRANKCK